MKTGMAHAMAACGVLGVSLAAFGQAKQDIAGALSATVEAILVQAQTQHQVSGQMASLIQKFRALVADMQSNKRLTDRRAQELLRLIDGITRTDVNHVRRAAELLQKAYAEESARPVNLESAGTEVQNALDRLTALLRQANALQASEMITAELERIIRAQEELIAHGTRVYKEMVQGLDKFSAEPAALAGEQEKLAGRTSGLQELVGVAMEEEMTEEGGARLKRAAAFMEQEKIDARMQIAARNIERRDMIPGVTEQKEALVALRKLAKILSQDDLANLADLRSGIEQIYQDQKDLRAQVEKMQTPKFNEEAARKRMDQEELKNRLEELMKELQGQREQMEEAPPTGANEAKGDDSNDPSNPEGKSSEPGEKAEQAMERASEAMGERNQQATTENQAQAERMLAEMMKQLDQEMLAMRFPGISPELMAAMLALQAQIAALQAALLGDPSLAGPLEAAMAAMAGLEAQAQGMAGAQGQGEGNGEGMGEGNGEGKGEGNREGKGGKGGKVGMARRGGRMPGGNLAQFGMSDLYGARRGENETSITSSLSKRDRSVLDENFAQELPREYREMLKAYYDKLSRK